MSLETEQMLQLERLVDRGIYKSVSEANSVALSLLFKEIEAGKIPTA